jgi:hypothetical protein
MQVTRPRLACLAWPTVASLALTALGFAQIQSSNPSEHPKLVSDGATRIADPKLAGGGVEVAFHLSPAGASTTGTLEVLRGAVVVASIWSGTLTGGAPPTTVFWNGKDGTGAWLDTGAYTIRLSAPGIKPLVEPLDLVRLGVTEIEFQDSAAGDDEFQMVYFRKGGAYAYYATPAIHEYLDVADAGEVADLDLNDGSPRPVVAVHTPTDSPPMEGSNYEDDQYNFPISYVMGSTPRLELTFGATACSSSGTQIGAGYPVAGQDIRVQAWIAGFPIASSGPIQAGGTATVDLRRLMPRVGRQEMNIEWRWQSAPEGSSDWSDIPGATTISHRFYTLLGSPNFKANASGTQYTGPWVEVCEYLASWFDVLGLPSGDQMELTELFVKGFFGQNGGLPTAIEGVMYDCYPLGGDGGATHYFMFGAWNMDLSSLLNQHAKGVYVNCSDNMGAATTMLAMLGADGMRSVRLGGMILRAIWGIGAPGYTLNLWGSGHSFSYHHIISDDGAVTVSDTCMQLDEDGDPDTLPGVPGWNAHRLWDGPGGYEDLSAHNNVTKVLEDLPGLK